jgi:hypothetical protein
MTTASEELYWARGFSSAAHSLKALEMAALLAQLRAGAEGLAAQVHMLRSLAKEDLPRYQERKRHLPFFIPARFRSGIRRADHLEAAHGWVLDLDHCRQSQAQFEALQLRLWQDPRVWLLYVSPSGEGLKLLFRFAEPLTHTKAFSDCYQAFARQFARQYDLHAYLDFKTHDVTRVSFLSHDPAARLRRDPLRLHPQRYLQIDPGPLAALPRDEPPPEEDSPPPPSAAPISPSLFPELLSPLGPGPAEAIPPEPEAVMPTPKATPDPPLPPAPSGEIWDQIRQTLRPEQPLRRRRVTLPPEIEALSPAIIQAGEGLGLHLKDTLDLNYGRKFVFGYQLLWAEVNVYYGKHGFSVVRSPKGGSHPQLMELVYELIHQLIFDPEGLSELARRVGSNPPWA